MLVQWPDPGNYPDFKQFGAALLSTLQLALDTSRIDVGSIKEFRGSLPETGYLPTNGTSFDPASYPELFAKLGTNILPTLASAYGVGYVVGIKT